jgi:hypothetical protein
VASGSTFPEGLKLNKMSGAVSGARKGWIFHLYRRGLRHGDDDKTPQPEHRHGDVRHHHFIGLTEFARGVLFAGNLGGSVSTVSVPVGAEAASALRMATLD